jgi:hypothetical protein
MVAALAGQARADTDDDCAAASAAATDLQKQGKLVESRTAILKCAAAVCPAQLRDVCNLRADRLAAAIPTIVFDVKDGDGNDLADVTVSIDGVASSQSIMAAFTANPGAHKFTFQVGRQSVEKTFVLHESEKGRRETITFANAAKPPEVKVTLPVETNTATTTATTSPDQTASDGSGRRIAGGVIAVLGLLGGGVVGGIFMGMYASNHSAFLRDCPTVQTCNTTLATADSSAETTDSTAGAVAFVAGGVLAVVGALIFFTAPKGPSKTALTIVPSVGTLNGLFLGGQF